MSVDITIGDPILVELSSGTVHVRHLAAFKGAVRTQEGLVVSGCTEPAEPIPVRVQSSCVFSEALGSQDCDCAAQLRAALNRVSTTGGFVIYLYEEGRGIGLGMKIEAIRVQQEAGADTAVAFKRLGLDVDPRSHEVAAAAIVQLLGERPVRLLTNNPHKTESLRQGGVRIVDEQRLIVQGGPVVDEYLAEKARVLGHVLDDD